MFKWVILLLVLAAAGACLGGMGVSGGVMARLLGALSLMFGIALLIARSFLKDSTRR